MKVFIDPTYKRKDTQGDGGIRRVSEAQHKYLPDFGIETVDSPAEADVINNHGAAFTYRHDVPLVNSNHGLYWARYKWDSWADDVNARVIDSMKRSDAVTAPSKWVRNALVRGMMIDPVVVYHGVEADEFMPAKNEGYVLWNKARTDPVSDPADVNKLAAMLRTRKFTTTFGDAADNVKVLGSVAYDDMKNIIRHAGVYLATTRETFGIGTLEAMSAAVPVVGWDFGGQSEIIVNGETGYLASPGDYASLVHAIEQAFAHRKRIGENARQDVLERWGWRDKVGQYAEVFRQVYENHSVERPKVSVIVTCYNLSQYLNACLQSVMDQYMKDWECLIIDDCSTDETRVFAKRWTAADKRFKYYKTPENLKLCGARNYGIERANGKYIIMLDADDMFDMNSLAVLSEEMDRDRTIDIGYGHLDTVDESGSNRTRNSWPFDQYNWREQLAHLNQLPYSSMIRREVFDNCGGYRVRAWRAEDANMWCRLTSFGYTAKKVTNAATLVYRNRSDSKSKGEDGDGDWTSWYPWRIAGSVSEAKMRIAEIRNHKLPNPDIVPFGAQGTPPYNWKAWPVHDRAYPVVSVVIPVGPGHEELVIDAVESVMSQTYPEWEVIVVNDTGKKWEKGFKNPLAGAQYAKLVETDKVGTGAARNAGAKIAKGELLIFLDADDMLLPQAMEKFISYYEVNNGIIYCDWLRSDSDGGPLTEYQQEEFACGDVLKRLRHSVTALVPRKNHEAVGGFDETMEGWEDWDYYIALQTTGLCSFRIPEPLFVYRFRKGSRREQSFGNKEKLVQYIRQKYADYYERRKSMPCSSCSKTRKPRKPTTPTTATSTSNAIPENTALVNLEYLGPHLGPITIRGGVTGNSYRFGRTVGHKIRPVDPQDAQLLVARTSNGKPLFKVV